MNNMFNDLPSILEKTKTIYIDVGLSHDAPHTLSWLKNDPDCFVFGFEPVRRNCDRVNYLMHKNGYESRFKLYECAVDNVLGITTKKFYITRNSEIQDDHGQSSLYRAKESVKDRFWVDQEIDVTCVNISDLIKQLNINSYRRIKCLKLDTQGNDFNILKSLESTLELVDSVQCEAHTYNTYEKEEDNQQSLYNLYSYMTGKGFQFHGNLADVDHFYIRSK